MLPRLVDVLVSTTCRPIEVLICHSGPGAVTVRRPHVTVLHQEPLALASASRNFGARFAAGHYLFFMDDDNFASPGLVDILAAVLDDDETVVEVGPAMYYADDPNRVYCFGVKHAALSSRTVWVRTVPADGSRLIPSDALPNAFMVRREQFDAVGRFDEVNFPMDFEESDLALRLRRAFRGRVVCSLDAQVWHKTSLSGVTRLVPKSPERSYYSARNRPIFVAQHSGWLPWAVYVIAGQWVACGARMFAIVRAGQLGPASRCTLAWGYARGMVVGLARSFRAVLR